MKSIVVIAVFGCLVSCTQAPPAEQSIRSVLDAQVQAWNNGDIGEYMKGYWNSEETSFVSGGSMRKGYDEVLARYKSRYSTRDQMGSLSFDELTIRMLSSASAVVTGVWKLMRSEDNPWGRFTLIVEKKPEGWRIVYDHTSTENP